MEVDRASLESVVNSILDSLSDKDDLVRQTLQQSLIKIVEKHPDESVNLIVDFRNKHPKLPEQIVAVLLRVLENSTAIEVNIKEDTIRKVVNTAIVEMTKPAEHVPNIQNPAMEILVALGRKNCELVLNELVIFTKDGSIPHFMVMHCMGTLAIANTTGSYPFIKDILQSLLPNLGAVKNDTQKEALAYAVGKFSEALMEFTTAKFEREKCFDGPESPSEFDRCSTELSVAYDILFNQWLNTREQKLSTEILESLSSIYPLLPIAKIHDQSQRLVPIILGFYRRSLDRIALTQFLASVLKTNINLHRNTLDSIIDILITQLFELTCVYPDYEKPQTVKGHYEVLRCYDLLADTYSSKILDFLLFQLKSNGERERIKSLLILTHLTNTSSQNIAGRLPDFLEILKQLIHTEKAIKMRMALLKALVAFAQKCFIKDREFVKFLVRFSCKYTKQLTEHGSPEEHNEFVQSCQNSLFMLSSTAGTMDELLKRELLNFFLLIDFTCISSTIMKCLASLFAKNAEIEFDVSDEDAGTKIIVPSCEEVFARCLALLGNFQDIQRISNILTFLQFYYPHLNPDLNALWSKLIPELNLNNSKEDCFFESLYVFVSETVGFLNKNDENFAERLANKMSDQLHLYPVQIPNSDFFIPQLHKERGMLAQCLGITCCFITDPQTIDFKMEMLISTGKNEKLDKHTTYKELEEKIDCFAKSLGFMSKTHVVPILKKLKELAQSATRKHSTGFFSNLNFMKDSQKEADSYKTNLLLFISYGYILEFSEHEDAFVIIEDSIIHYMINQLNETKDLTMKNVILNTFLKLTEHVLKPMEKKKQMELKLRNEIIQAIFNINIEPPFDNLPLLPSILKLGNNLIKIDHDDSYDGGVLFEIACKNFFQAAQHLKTKFDSTEEDEKNSFLAQYLNQCLPEIKALVKIIIELDPSPSNLDLIISILESWTKDRNSEVRICASHVFNNSLEVYIKSMKIGCEAPSKFNQTGLLLGKIVPRCIDTNATVRHISVEILQKTLEISCIYDTLTIAGSDDDWIRQLEEINEFIISDDPEKIQKMAGEIAKIIAFRISNYQYLQFCKTLLMGLQDNELTSAIGSSVVLKVFIQEKGSELFHCIPELVNESFLAIKDLHKSRKRAKSGVLKAIVALTKHHPKLVCNEMLSQNLPFEENVVEYWHTVCLNPELSAQIIENFLAILLASCLYDPSNENAGDRQKIANVQTFAIFCAMREMFPSKEIKEVLKSKFPELFAMLITSLATYTNLAPPMLSQKSSSPVSNKSAAQSSKTKYGFIPNKDSVKMNPCQVVLETFLAFLNNLGMEQLSNVLTVCPQLAKSADLTHFIELLIPMANGLDKQFTIASGAMKDICTALSKYVASPYEGQRVASIGLFSQLVPFKPFGEISSCIMFHLNSGLSDPSPLVRGLCIMGMAYIGSLMEADSLKYSEIAITSLLKGIEDNNPDCLINLPLESLRGLSRILQTLPTNRVESFHVSLAIRIRPFFGNNSEEIREAAINLFGDLCETKMNRSSNSDRGKCLISNNEALREQLFHNFSTLVLHLGENDPTIVRACKSTLRKVTHLIQAPKINEMSQKHLIDHGTLNFSVFVFDFIKLAGEELPDHVQDFIDSCIPHLKSQWPEIRGNAAIVMGILNNYLLVRTHNSDIVGQKIAALLKDENHNVRVKAALALGYFFGDL